MAYCDQNPLAKLLSSPGSKYLKMYKIGMLKTALNPWQVMNVSWTIATNLYVLTKSLNGKRSSGGTGYVMLKCC